MVSSRRTRRLHKCSNLCNDFVVMPDPEMSPRVVAYEFGARDVLRRVLGPCKRSIEIVANAQHKSGNGDLLKIVACERSGNARIVEDACSAQTDRLDALQDARDARLFIQTRASHDVRRRGKHGLDD